MAGADDNGKDTGGKVVSIRVPMLTITFDPRTYKVELAGNTPSFEFGKMMLSAAADELERSIVAQRNEQRIALVSADLLGNLKRGA